MYYRAKELAISNGRTYHLAAILRRNGKVVRVGENTYKTHPRFRRQYPDGTWGSHMHAEMNVLRFAQPGDEIEVRDRKKGQLRIASALKIAATREDCDWIEVDEPNLKGVYKSVPDRTDLSTEINENLIVELYSK